MEKLRDTPKNKNKNKTDTKKMEYVLMTPTAHLPVHGLAYPAAILKPYLRTSRTSWLVPAGEPHACRVTGCAQMREYVRCLWARVARTAAKRREAKLALWRVFPVDIAARILGFARVTRSL